MVPTGPGGAAAVIGWALVIAAGVAVGLNVGAESAPHHWWANFVLLPGLALLALAVPGLTRRGGSVPGGYAVACVGALIAVVGALLLAGEMHRGWPLMIVFPSLAIAGTYTWHAGHPVLRGLHRTVAGLALVAVLLGLLLQLTVFGADFGGLRWWGAVVLLAGLVIGANGVELLGHRIRYRVQAATLLIGPALVLMLLGVRLFNGLPPPADRGAVPPTPAGHRAPPALPATPANPALPATPAGP